MQDADNRRWTGDNVFSSGDLVEDLTHNFFLETGARNNIKAGLRKCLYRFSQDAFHELGAVFNRPHPETGEDLVIAEETHPEGAPANDLPAQRAVFAPGPIPT